MPVLRAGLIVTLFLLFTLPLMPLQLALLRLHRGWARRLPHWYHRKVCRLLGVRIHLEGAPSRAPVLFVANHISWLDIPVLSALAPVSFVAKREVSTWPFIAWLARLQRTVFVDRERRREAGASAREIMERLHAGDNIVLFAEGTSSDGNAVLPFKTPLFAAVMPSGPQAKALERGIAVQTMAVAYTHIWGLPLDRRERPVVAWYGDMDMAGHVWRLLKRGPVDVRVRLGPPVPLEEYDDRKALARAAEARVRADVADMLSPRHSPQPRAWQWTGPAIGTKSGA